MKIEIEIDYNVLDDIVLQRLKEVYEDHLLWSTQPLHPEEKEFNTEIMKALKVVMGYFEVPSREQNEN